MKQDIDVNKLSQQEIEQWFKDSFGRDSRLRDEILTNPIFKSPSFNELILNEWKQRIDGVFESEACWEGDDIGEEICIDWQLTLAELEDAVENLRKRGQIEDALSLIDDTEAKVLQSSQDVSVEGDDGDFYVEFDIFPEDFDEIRYMVVSEDKDARKEFFEECREAAEDGDLSNVWLEKYTSPEERSVQIDTIRNYIKRVGSKDPWAEQYRSILSQLLEKHGKNLKLKES